MSRTPHRSARYPQFGLPSGPGRSRPTETGLYRFTLSEAGIATLKIAGQTFGPAYREATQFVVGPHYVVQGTVHLTAGQPVPVEVDYSSSSGLFSHEIHFGWQSTIRVGDRGRGCGGAPRGCRRRVRQRRTGRGHGPQLAVAARRSEPVDRRGRPSKPPHDRGAQHGWPGAHALAQRGSGRARGVVSGTAVRLGHRGRAVRRCRPRRAAAGHVPRQREPGPGAGHAAKPLSGSQRRRELRRRPGRRLPLVRRHRTAPAVSVRLWPFLPAL